jgi:chemotaxis protein methyltransferase WspC
MVLEYEHLLQASIGLDVASIGRSAVEHAVRERQHACELGPAAYWDRVRDSEAELQALIDAVVVPETWFFRDGQAFDTFRRFVRDEWMPAHLTGTLRVLSLPASTGEEPYSIAMALLDMGVPAEQFAIDAIDVSERSLARARNGVYRANSFRESDLGFRERYFDEEPSGHRLQDQVRRLVQFRRGNICVAESLPATTYDVIFCRNLLIYFNRPTQDRAISLLEGLLVPNGLLFVAPSEGGLILGRPDAWTKDAAAFRFHAQTPIPTAARHARRAPVAPIAPAAPIAPFAPLAPIAPLAPLAPLAPIAPLVTPGLLDKATRLADLGRFTEAATHCEDHLRQHGPSAAGFQLLGVLRDAVGDSEDAMACYRKSLYLDPNNQEVLIHLALLLERLGRKAEAQLLRRRERRIAERMAAS